MIAPALPSPALAPVQIGAACCPFHEGAATLDLLLAELDPRDAPLFNAALELRFVGATASDPAACVELLFRVRALLEERHYLAFYRVRRWARRMFQIEVRAGRGSPWKTRELPLDGGRLDEVVNAALASIATEDGIIPASAHVRFVVAPAAQPHHDRHR